MKNNKLLRTNILIIIILLNGFLLTGILSYKSNYQASLDNIEQVSSLSAEGIYYQISSMFATPINTSLTMAHDSLLANHILKEAAFLDDEEYIQTTTDYLKGYQKKYGFDSVFLVTSNTMRYYSYNGLDRILTEDDPENIWYYSLLQSNLNYSLKVDNDQVNGANDEITVFVNCKIFEPESGNVLGVVGVGIRIAYLKELLKSYEEKFYLNASLIDETGDIEISTTHTGFERVNWFAERKQENIREKVLKNKDTQLSTEMWTTDTNGNKNSYIVCRFIPEMSWYLLVEQDTKVLVTQIRNQVFKTFLVLIIVVLIVIFVITGVIRNFNKQITQLMEERQDIFKKATEQLYDNIYELNITKNCYVGKQTEQYFERLGAKGLPYDEGLRVVADSQIKKEYREEYLSSFSPSNVIEQYKNGNNHLRYDFMITENGTDYHWMRIDSYIFYSHEDNCIHMFTYRKNIDGEKRRELRAQTDEMTGFHTKKAAERIIQHLLSETSDRIYALFMFDIDNFKQANDSYGHAFGDFCIKSFTGIIRNYFQESDLFGRMGGDEFIVFLPVPSADWIKSKSEEISKALATSCTKEASSWNMSASIGIAVVQTGAADFEMLFQKADEALYYTKRHGKNGFTILYIGDPFHQKSKNHTADATLFANNETSR